MEEFSCCREDEGGIGESIIRRIIELEKGEMKEMQVRMKKMEGMVEILANEKGVWKGVYGDLLTVRNYGSSQSY